MLSKVKTATTISRKREERLEDRILMKLSFWMSLYQELMQRLSMRIINTTSEIAEVTVEPSSKSLKNFSLKMY